MLGINTVTPNLKSGPYLFFDLTFIDWDHSLLAAVFWSLLWGALFMKHKPVAVVAALAAFSHFLADWPMHNADLALFPNSVEHLGYGLWGKLGTLSWVLEGIFSLGLVAWAWCATAKRNVSLMWPAVVLVALFLQLSPVASPMKLIATLNEPYTHMLHGALVSLGFLLPGLLLTWLLDRSERQGLSIPIR